MKKNECFTVKIEDMSHEGAGIGKVDGFPLFIKDTVIGDEARIAVTKLKKSYGYARLVEVIDPSKDRVSAVCPVAKQCGGCQIQELSYEKQLEFKKSKIKNNLQRLGGFSETFLEETMNPVLGMEDPWKYRNKAQFPIGTGKDGNIITGFYAGRTHQIVPCTDCAIGVDENRRILQVILDFMNRYHISAYNEETQRGLVRHVLIRKGFTTKELMVCLVINGRKLPDADKLIESLSMIEGMKSISVSINRENTNVIMGTQIETLWGQDYIEDYIGDIKYQISPLSFYQVNPIQTRVLYQTALDFADLHHEETVWDLYCGIGTISLFLAQKAKKVYGVEIVEPAVEDAKRNAAINSLDNVTFFAGKAEEILPDIYKKRKFPAGMEEEWKNPDVIVVDPPRKGCEESLLETMVSIAPERIVYVSCDSATLARDLKYLCANGYQIKKIQGVDMFPNTVHVETVCLLSKLYEAKHHVSVKLDMDEMDLTSAESKATYEEIKAYVAEHNGGMHVSSLNIAQMKDKYGIKERENYNHAKSEDARQPGCTPEKEAAIVEAFKYFMML